MRLPLDMPRKQVLFFDGIRFAIQMADLSYGRLIDALARISRLPDGGSSQGPWDVPGCMLDAWSMVDSCQRLRQLVAGLPGMKQNSPGVQLFLRGTSRVEDLRNLVQHLRNEIDSLVSLGVPVWGDLRWFIVLDREPFRGRACGLMAGALFEGQHPVVNPAGLAFRGAIDHVTLRAGELEVSLSETILAIGRLATGLEAGMRPRFEGQPHHPADAVTYAEVVAGETATPATVPQQHEQK
jgi:hypothetical protein